MELSKEQRESKIAALLRERTGCVSAKKTDRVTAIDEQLKTYGYKSEETRKTPPTERTAERPRETVARPEAKS